LRGFAHNLLIPRGLNGIQGKGLLKGNVRDVRSTCDSSVAVIITPSTCHVTSHVMYVTGPFNDSSTDYLLVADYNQQHVYQLQPSTGELRSLFTDKIRALAIALDASRRLVYLAYVQGIQYRIRKRSFDSRVNSVIYYAPSGVVSLHYMSFIFNFVLLFILTWLRYSVVLKVNAIIYTVNHKNVTLYFWP